MGSLTTQKFRDAARTGRETRPPLAILHFWFAVLCMLSILVAHAPLNTLARLALHDERYTPVLVVPFIAIGLIWLKRTLIFAGSRPCFGVGVPLLLGSVFALNTASLRASLSATIFAVLLLWAGSFFLCYGARTARRALFPLLFLLLMIPIPAGLLDKIVSYLQTASAEIAYGLFRLTGVPVFREDLFTFSLPGVTIQVARECSGIRSSLSLLISSIVAGYLFLRSGWGRASLIFLTIPIAIFKNAVRIVTISWLGVYVDRGFLHGDLHRYGGLPFSLLALTMLIPILFLLHNAERGSLSRKGPRCD